MVAATQKFASEYSVLKGVLGQHSKVYCQKSWNSSAWMEISDTAMFHRFLLDQMANSKRVSKGKDLSIRLAFGRAKARYEFKDEDEFNSYVDVVDGDAIVFSQNSDGHSPYENKKGTVLREGTWRYPAKIAKLIQFMYTDETTKIFYGFTREHANSFYRIISINLSTNKDASPFLPYLTDKINALPTEEIVDNSILTVYSNYHSSDVYGILPQLNKFPPTNEAMCRVPPLYNDWKSSSSSLVTPIHQRTRNNNFNNIQTSNIQFTDSNVNNIGDNTENGEITVIRFVYDNEEACVIIEPPLTLESTLSSVEKDNSFTHSYISYLNDCRFIIQTNSGSGYNMKWTQLRNMKVSTFFRLKNVHDDYTIKIVNKK